MRIMIVTEEFLPASDGLVLRLTEAIRYFLKEGHQVVVITPDRGIDQFEEMPPSTASRTSICPLAKSSSGRRRSRASTTS